MSQPPLIPIPWRSTYTTEHPPYTETRPMPIARFAQYVAGVTLLTLVAVGAPALAAGLQISPISITIPADKKADEIWLRNTSAEVVHAQVRVYHWSQDQGEDVLVPEQSMVA